MTTWEECYKHDAFDALNYSYTDCFNCPHRNEKNDSCGIKRENRKAREGHADFQREWTNWNAGC